MQSEDKSSTELNCQPPLSANSQSSPRGLSESFFYLAKLVEQSVDSFREQVLHCAQASFEPGGSRSLRRKIGSQSLVFATRQLTHLFVANFQLQGPPGSRNPQFRGTGFDLP
jgi:hypothetical protein